MKSNYHKSNSFALPIALWLLTMLPLFTHAQLGRRMSTTTPTTIGSAAVDVRINILPPYPSKWTDYASRPQQFLIILHNNTTTVQNVQLRGSFSSNNGISVATGVNYKSASPIVLGPNETRNLNFTDITGIFDINKVTYTGITEQQAVSQGGLPEGSYQACLQAYDYYSNAPLSQSSPSGCSNIFNISNVDPPTVIAPYDTQVLQPLAGQNFVISWSTPPGAPPSTQYTVRIVEVLANRSPAEALNTAISPIFFQQTVSGTNSLLYGPAMPGMTLGRLYAMSITATDPFNTVTFKNKGQSVVTSFVYGVAPKVVPATTTSIASIARGIPVVPPITGLTVAPQGISGTIDWYYRKSEEATITAKIAANETDPADVPGAQAHPVANHQLNVVITPHYHSTIAPGGVIKPVIPPNPKLPAFENADREADAEATLEGTFWQGATLSSRTDANGNFVFQLPNISDLMGSNNKAAMQKLGISAVVDSVTVSIAIADEAYFTMPGAHGYYISLKPGHFQDNIFLGTIKALAHTYRLLPKVYDANGTELTDGTVNIYRRADFYATHPDLTSEGNLNPSGGPMLPVTIDGVPYIKIASLNEGQTATRLFYPSADPTDQYKLIAQEKNYSDYEVPYPTPSYDLTTQLYIAMNNAPTTFTGHVYRTINGVETDVQGAKVQFTQPGKTLLTTTDQQGNFTYKGVVATKTHLPYSVIVPNAPAFLDSVLVDYAGENVYKNIGINATTYPVSGTITDVNGVGLPNPLVRWASGGNYMTTDAYGKFSTTNITGADTLIISKVGYADKHVLVQTGTNGAVIYNGVSHGNGAIGNIALAKAQTYINITLVDALNAQTKISGATISIDGADTPQTFTTNSAGQTTITGTSGTVILDIMGPANSTYAPMQQGYYVDANGTLNLTVKLNHGVRVSGTVSSAAGPVSGALITADGFDFAAVTTQSNGAYSLIVPAGYGELIASKQGFSNAEQDQNFLSAQTLNFTLTATSVNITKMLGFDVQISQVQNGANGHKIISGTIVNVPSNSVFSVSKSTKIRFDAVEVTVQSDGSAVPIADEIYTSENSLNMKAFGFLPVQLVSNDDFYSIAKISATKGQIQGTVVVNYSGFMPSGIAAYARDGAQILAGSPSATSAKMGAINSDGSSPLNGTSLYFNTGSDATFNLYGFAIKLNLANSLINATSGLHLAGSVDLSSIPILSGQSFTLQDLNIGTDGTVKALSATGPGGFKIAGWGATIGTISFSDNGFKVDGSLSVQLPSTKSASNITFTGLQIAKDQLYGGSFKLPTAGIDVFDIVTLTPGTTPISFGKLGSENVYYISGSGNITITAPAPASTFLNVNSIAVTSFQIQTDGRFAINASGLKQEKLLGDMAVIDVSGVSIDNTSDNPQLYIQGKFSLNIPEVQGTAGGIHFRKSGVSVDDLGLDFNIAGIFNGKANISFSNTPGKVGFAGSGGFSIIGLASVGVQMHYYKVTNGYDVGTDFQAGVLIPLGPSGIAITGLGGGFEVNTATKYWQVNITGKLSVAGMGALTGADVKFSVASGPVITGTATMYVAGMDAVSGTMSLNIPKSQFYVSLSAGVHVPGLSAHATGDLMLSFDPGDKYFLLGTQADLSLLGIIKAQGGVCVAYNLNVNKHRSDLGNYINGVIDPDAISKQGGVIFTGVSAGASASEDLDDILPNFDFNFGIGFGVHSTFGMKAQGYVTAALINKTPTFAINCGVEWHCGVKICESVWFVSACEGISAGFNAGFTGFIAPGRTYMNAYGEVYLSATLAWITFTIDPKLSVTYDTNKNPVFSASF